MLVHIFRSRIANCCLLSMQESAWLRLERKCVKRIKVVFAKHSVVKGADVTSVSAVVAQTSISNELVWAKA